MSALLELIREAPPEDRKAAAEMLRPYLVTEAPKKQSVRYVSLPQFKKEHNIKKRLDWCRLFLLPKMPGAYGLNQGKGHHITIDSHKASEWLDKHGDEIDWNQPMP
ncbi:hypothetical protein [Limosilactobacillus fermentum]|uniref:hypothetical protein n=1 Tax=Limosilactobacillus fermentum TaxID=1613 RepID=UPI002AC95A6A|nr:hypothetical protein [Limosilactobacillus fermentum]